MMRSQTPGEDGLQEKEHKEQGLAHSGASTTSTSITVDRAQRGIWGRHLLGRAPGHQSNVMGKPFSPRVQVPKQINTESLHVHTDCASYGAVPKDDGGGAWGPGRGSPLSGGGVLLILKCQC